VACLPYRRLRLNRTKRVTRKDVALRAGVSTATISYVINDGPRPVASETRERVLKAIEDLGYYPNELARSLRISQTSTIGLVVPDLTNPFYADLARALESITFSRGYVTIVCNSNREASKELRFAELLRAKQVDGVVFLPDSDSMDAIFTLIKANIPVVVLEHQDIPGLHGVAIDDFQGGLIATEHLVNLGHRRIAFLRQRTSHTTSQRRLEGYIKALQSANIEIDKSIVVDCEATSAAGAEAMANLLARRRGVTAVFAHNDVIALGAMHAIYCSGLSIPGDISIIGYDNIDAAAFYHPPLTTVRYPSEAVARSAARQLFSMLDGKSIHQTYPTNSIELIPVDLVLRQSTGPVRSR